MDVIKSSLILRMIGKICEHNKQIMGVTQKSNAQIYEHNGLTPNITTVCCYNYS